MNVVLGVTMLCNIVAGSALSSLLFIEVRFSIFYVELN